MRHQITKDKFEYFEDSELPKLVLGIKSLFLPGDFLKEESFSKEREWLHISHQTAGHSCHQHYIFGTILTPTPKTHIAMFNLSKMWLDSDVGMFGVSLNEILTYRSDIQNLLNVDCNISYKDFEEGIYPIDCSTKNINMLTTDILPENLDDLLTFENPKYKSFGCINRWNLWILGENCD